MTSSPKTAFTMQAVLKNIEIRGSTMGSRKEFHDMVKFMTEKQLKPTISKVVTGGLEDLKAIEGLFEEMDAGTQFGKLIFKVNGEGHKTEISTLEERTESK